MLLMVLALAEVTTGAFEAGPRVPPSTVAAASAMPQVAKTVALEPPPAPAGDALPPVAPSTSRSAPVAVPVAPARAGDSTAQQTGAVSMGPPAAGPLPASVDYGEIGDPWIKVNRSIFKFDTTLEKAVLAPVAHGYEHVVPHVVRFHISSALFNLEEPLTAANDLLQLRIGAMSKAVVRFIINSTVGIAGLFDVANASGVPPHVSDFGQTLGRYGVNTGPYVVLPVFGPSDVRDGLGRLIDSFVDPVYFFIGGITSPQTIALFVMNGVDWRSRSDDAIAAVYSATDPYAFARAAYAQTRVAKISEATGKEAALPDFDAPGGTP